MTTEQPETLVTDEMVASKDVWSEPRTSWPVSVSDIRKWAQSVYWPEVPPRLYWDEDYAKGTKYGGIIAPQEFNPFAWPLEGSYGQEAAQAVYWPEVPPSLYWDEDYAKGTKYGGIIAPQEFNPFAWPLEGSYGQEAAQAEVRGTPPPESARAMGSGPGSNAMNGGQTVTYHTPIRPGDVISSTTALTDWNERQTRLGLTMFVTNETRWTNQNGELVKVTKQVSIRY